jgi:peptidoglycan/LPS O-acetylase OafA/YrhL
MLVYIHIYNLLWIKEMSVFSKTDKTKSPNYQPGIDGLRAVAVLLVLIFHVGFDFLPGGFVGVDVFFVISGYLITGIIYDQMNNDRFNYIQFILARISRLYPALLFTLVFVFIGCFLLYSPNDFIDVSRSAIYALFSASNMFFANSAGYFDTSSEINPLLHTWSLGVEQQFYLIWPIMIASVFFIRKTLVPVLLLIVTVASVIASQWATQNMPTESYYWMPFRVFELSIGGLSFFVSRKVKIGGGLKEIMMALGVMMIISSAIIFSSATQFPGFNALLPVAGAALCILSHDSRYFGLIVNNKISVGVGIVSYSVYLIHWPIIILYKYWVFRELRNIEKCSIIALSIIIGVMMYYLVENKFRKIKIYKSSVESAFFISCLLIVLLSFSSSIKLNGFPYRISDSSASLYSNSKKYHSEFFGGGAKYKNHHFLQAKRTRHYGRAKWITWQCIRTQ